MVSQDSRWTKLEPAFVEMDCAGCSRQRFLDHDTSFGLLLRIGEYFKDTLLVLYYLYELHNTHIVVDLLAFEDVNTSIIHHDIPPKLETPTYLLLAPPKSPGPFFSPTLSPLFVPSRSRTL